MLATDGDLPGQALAEELARRLGKERFVPSSLVCLFCVPFFDVPKCCLLKWMISPCTSFQVAEHCIQEVETAIILAISNQL